jgi:hypothetical protein
MLDVARLVFVYCIINWITIVALVSIRELPTDDIVVNLNKGYALKRIGLYSPNIVEQIVHTFVSLDNFCAVQTTDAVCKYTSTSTTKNIMELATMITPRHARDTSSTYDREIVSKLIAKDLIRIVVQHKPDEFLRDTKSSVHVINNQFHYQKNDDKALTPASSINTVDNYNDILRFHPASVDIIIKQINNNRISFEYLSLTDLKLFLTTVFSNIDESYKINNVEESLNAFSQLIVGQSVYALRYCALGRQHSLSSKPCLAVSTLFLRVPTDNVSIFSIYRLIPLPIIFDHDKYIYSNLPKVIGINSIDETLVMWNDDFDNTECTFSPIVLCQYKPVSMSLSKPSCLSQLFDDHQLATNMCEVSRSQNIGQGVLHIDDGLWLFYNINHTHYCQVYSNLNEFTQTITINEAAIVRIPCHNTVICPDFQLPAASCKANRVIVTPSFTFNIQNLPHFIVSIKNMTQTLVSTHHMQFEKSIREFMIDFISNRSKFKETMRDFGMYILYVICCIFIMIVIYVIKLIKYKRQNEKNDLDKLKKEVNNLDSQIQDIIDF